MISTTIESILLFTICLMASLFIVRLFFIYVYPILDRENGININQAISEISGTFTTRREASEKILGSKFATLIGYLISTTSQISLVYLSVYSPICFWLFLTYLVLGFYKTKRIKLPSQAELGPRIMARFFYATLFPLIKYS